MFEIRSPSVIGFLTGLALTIGLQGCGSNSDSVALSMPDNTMNFNCVATFTVCSQIGSSCESNDVTAAETAAASTDGMTVIYTDSPKGQIGFVDITDPTNPKPLGKVATGGEPTSVAVVGNFAVVGVDTSTSFTAPSGKLVVLDITRMIK